MVIPGEKLFGFRPLLSHGVKLRHYRQVATRFENACDLLAERAAKGGGKKKKKKKAAKKKTTKTTTKKKTVKKKVKKTS